MIRWGKGTKSTIVMVRWGLTGNRKARMYVAGGIRVEGKEGSTETTAARLRTCKRGLGSYNCWRAVRPVNAVLIG